MSATTLFIGIIVFIILLIICIHAYDRHLVKEIKIYEKRLEKKGIFKRHFITTGSSKKKMIIKCKNCSNEFVVKVSSPSQRISPGDTVYEGFHRNFGEKKVTQSERLFRGIASR